MAYIPLEFWSELVRSGSDLSAVGHPALGAYNRIAYHFRLEAFRRAIGASVPHWPNVRIFEGGFGVGFYLQYYAHEGVRSVAGIDLSVAAVAMVQGRFQEFRLVQGDLSEQLAFPEDGFDLVTATDVLYHIVDDRRWHQALAQLCDLVAPGGALLLTDKFPREGIRQAFPHVRRRSLSEYKCVFEERGLKLEYIRPVFVLMDDPITCGAMRWLGYLSLAQWTVVQKVIRMLWHWPWLRDVVAVFLAGLQFPFEWALVRLLDRTPNLEILVARKI
ncbi:MAG: class I SAM-dependent methyltransferase [Actinomycetota bacterium]|nr:class I SAM-dependent methyltransferase [Actinomycetota bacterium]